MKRLIKHSIRQAWVALLLLLATGGCTDDTFVEDNRPVVDENGMVTLRFDANIPGLKLTRSVDINGESISTLWIVAFNENKKMISRVLATINVDANTGNSGTFTAKVPSSTRILHFLANVNMDNFNDQENMGRDENEVIAPMVSSSGNLVYWGRKAFTDVPNLADETITLYRNQALVEYQVAESTGIQVLGWAAMNQYAYGTVAPFDASDTDNAFHFSLTGTEADDFVTTLPEAYNVKQTDVESVAQASSQEGDPRYLFETPNPENDQVYLIMLIQKDSGKAKYYKILLVDEEKTPYPIIRNHKYIVDIQNVNEAYGVESFEAAKTATPANNPWITIRDEVPEVVNGETTLRIEGKTTVLYQKEGDYEIAFYYNGSTRPTVEFISNEGVGEVTDVEWTKPNGTIHLHINAPAKGQIMEGTLQVKEGVLSRHVKIFVAEPFEFTQIWVGSEIPLLDGENIAVLFHIPDNFPEELLPVDVKFGCDLIDAQTNQPLKVITEETSYTVPNGPNSTHVVTKDWNYKYVYTADHIGQHRVDFRTILTNISSIEGIEEFHIYMEGDDPDTGQDMFKHRDLFFAFQHGSANDYQNRRRILLEGGNAATKYTTMTIDKLNPIYGEEIPITFHLAALQNDNTANPAWNPQTPNKYDPTSGGIQQNVSDTNPCEVWIYYDPLLIQPSGSWTTQQGQKDKYGNTYAVYTATAQENTITFSTISPNFDCYIVLSAKSDSYDEFDSDLGVNPAGWGFRSASVTVHSTGRLNFNPAFSTDGNNFTPINDGGEFAIPYGTEQNVYVRIDIEEAARGKAFQFRVKTSNLNPIAASVQEGQWTQEGDEWVYTFKEGETTGVNEKTFHFQTSRLASGETITLSSGNYVGYNPVEVRIKNKDLTGTIQLPDGVTFQISNPYIILERKRDGTRIGTFAITGDPKGQNSANYTLTLRGEYNLNAWDDVTIKWEPVSGEHKETVYSYSCQLQDIMKEGTTIILSANS